MNRTFERVAKFLALEHTLQLRADLWTGPDLAN